MAFVCEVKEMHIPMKEKRRLLRGLIQIVRTPPPSKSKKRGQNLRVRILIFAKGISFDGIAIKGNFVINF